MQNEFEDETLLSPPALRAAFSDRQAYICAVLSKYAYFPFEGLLNKKQTLEKIDEIVIEESARLEIRSIVSELFKARTVTPNASKKAFEKLLALGGAVAILFTRKFFASHPACCYTFGALPVANQELQNGLKHLCMKS